MMRSMPSDTKMPTHSDRQTDIYCLPKSCTIGSLSCQRMNASESVSPITVNTAALIKSSTSPLPAARFASAKRRSPSRREISEFMPTAVPTPTEIISSCSGFTVESALSALSPIVASTPG